MNNKIAIIGLDKKEGIWDFIRHIKQYEKDYPVSFDEFIYSAKDFHLYDKLNEDIIVNQYSAAISIGGDGTFIYSARIFAGHEIPVFGVNLSKFGFNTTIEVKDFDKYFHGYLDNTLHYSYKILLEVEIDQLQGVFNVMNEAVIGHTGISRMIRLKVNLDDMTICDFKGDGLIVSSPTGSTAYNLSAGGPILHPDVEAISLCPVCPHTLAIRPLIIPTSKTVHITVEESSGDPQITLDGQKIIILKRGQKITINKSPKRVKVIETSKNFGKILKSKLGWTV